MTARTDATATLTAMAGSRIVKALEDAYQAIRDRHPDLPEVVFITGTGLMGRGAKWGHYGHDRWVLGPGGDLVDETTGRVPEVFIAGERLACGAKDTLQTMLHESCHALARVRGIKEVSRDFRYHNRKFVALAEEVGLEWPEDRQPDPTIGFSAVEMTDATAEEYAEVIQDLQAAIVAHLDTFKGLTFGTGKGDGEKGGAGAIPPKPPKGPSRANSKAQCGCGRIIRASKRVLAEAPITCGSCGEDFRPVEEGD